MIEKCFKIISHFALGLAIGIRLKAKGFLKSGFNSSINDANDTLQEVRVER